MSTTPQSLPEGRYPTSRGIAPSRVLAVALTLLVIALGVAVAYLGYTKFTTPDVDGTMVSFDIVGEDRVDVRLNVTRDDPSQPAVCIIRSRSRDGTETGRREVLIPASENGTEDVRSFVITSAAPGLADLYGCSLDVPEHLTPR
ncbi:MULTISPECIES: DUF4307 domain-containing protein [unclassified Rhodococcus (in: high G+C Gram-positive bacteria)]|jgi:hypothetical protein|uniref:DUF4307 domain-containing protein n=1 Tax=unclassified Rhodococcus (in: high G+C Gram-positive bacteria) TaxID=192944 RepID=UPI00048586E0|nr:MULTISPECIES: DUF4307 domain-containing protein [unclassified Rhodococcus (in: high G+C Gram-positive bacteria)]MBY6677775.1 DUF4307 domain-containing protein [Rhodococcus sp. BP-332]MBY6706709.1 DUF4307 domain-containing protein [Rhodococcus sp. BP-241]MDQ1181071.1 hypothetical protein [Rhodococcus sp. SORGH_AS_0301]MDQ1202399.1 hypothetical protein [Rhodococcus sp. SORGH_AS_0303]